jgi:malate dehydrogenase (quinone)
MSETTVPTFVDVALIGAGIMSATVATLLKALDPSLRVAVFERLDDCALESSYGCNNAGRE